MMLFKILQEFLLPSVFVFVLILIGIILVFRKKREKLGKILIALGILFYYLFSITPLADLTLLPLESQYIQIEEDELGKTDKIVLLLGGMKKGRLPLGSLLEESTLFRASEALRIYFAKKENAKIIISGTSSLAPGKNEAEIVGEFLKELGVLPENIILEDKSRNTAESAKNIKELLDKEPLFLVTSAYHLPRSMEVFQKMGTNPVPAPGDFKVERSYNIFDFFPNPENLRKFDLAFHEYFGILFYRLYH